MIDKNRKFIISWNPKNKSYYESKGYIFTKYNDKFEVAFNDLHPNSSIVVENSCDHCGKKYDMIFDNYTDAMSKFGEVICQDCAAIRRANNTLKERQEKMCARILEFCELHNYILITKKEELINNQSVVVYICPIHGEYTTKVTNIQQGKQCYKCSRALALKKKNETTLKQRQETLYLNALNVCTKKGYELISKKEDITNNKT